MRRSDPAHGRAQTIVEGGLASVFWPALWWSSTAGLRRDTSRNRILELR